MTLRILLADDNLTAQNAGRKILAAAGYDVVTVSNGLAAVHKTAELRPDIVLLDVYMPGYSGTELCQQMKAAPETAQMPVVLTVGQMEPFCAEDGVKIKADGLIIKPFEAGNLISVVEKLAERVRGPQASIEPSVPAFGEAGYHPAKSKTADLLAPSTLAARLQLPAPAPAASSPAVEPAKCQPSTLPKQPDQPSAAPASGGHDTPPLPKQPDRPPVAPASGGHNTPSDQLGGEVCDVCGHLNPEAAFACQQCDVPLPSSVKRFPGAGKNS